VRKGEQELQPIPERRPPGGPEPSEEEEHAEELVGFTRSGIPVWRCKVCGYLCARPRPPLKCPICKADRDRFERFM
jgi:rubrerythrin